MKTRTWTYFLPKPPDADLRRAVARWADRRDFQISTRIESTPSVVHEGKLTHSVVAEVELDGTGLKAMESAYTGLRRIIKNWILRS